MATKRNKSAQTVVIVAPGEFGNNSPESITVSFPTVTRWNVTKMLPKFMTAAGVFEQLNGISTAKMVQQGVALLIKYDGDLIAEKTARKERTTTPKIEYATVNGVEINKTAMMNDLFIIWEQAEKAKAAGATPKELAAIAKGLGFPS